jgi:hypothetical protein
MSSADALYAVLAEQLSAEFLTDDHNLVEGPTFPGTIKVLQLPLRTYGNVKPDWPHRAHQIWPHPDRP